MNPFAVPHVASVVTGLAAVGLALAELVLVELGPVALDAVPEFFAPAPLAIRYQLA